MTRPFGTSFLVQETRPEDGVTPEDRGELLVPLVARLDQVDAWLPQPMALVERRAYGARALLERGGLPTARAHAIR